MPLQLSTLENVNLPELVEVFNAAFADYFVKIRFTEQSLTEKITAENIFLEKSVGVFADGKLAGFILIGIDDFDGNKTAYNSGTGVRPEFRGNNLSAQMYDFILPQLESEGIYSHLLEVIVQNHPAIRVYEKAGFRKTRVLGCFKGSINSPEINKNIEINILDEIDRELFSQFGDTLPSWQNSIPAIERTLNLHRTAGAFDGENLVGYIVYTESGRIKQLAVKKDFRHQGIARTLFAFVKSNLNDPEILITNIDEDSPGIISFLEKIGLNLFLEQFEMRLDRK